MKERLQGALRHAFGRRQGCAAVLDRNDGQVLAVWRPDLAKSWTFAPGSTLKPFVLDALLEHRLRAVPCRRTLRIGGLNLDCAHPPIAAPLDGSEALAVSCNSWFAQNTPELTPEELVRALDGLDASPRLPQSADEQKLLALGVAGLKVSASGLAKAYLRLSRHPSASVLKGLRAAVERGTGQFAGSGVAGKTGTTREAACFAGFDESLVVAVAMPGGTGGGDAAPVAGEVFQAWRKSR